MFAGKKSAQIREILINESAWEEMTCLFAPSLDEVKPHVDEAWINLDTVKIGYEISFNKYFYRHKPLRSLEEVATDIINLEQKAEGLIAQILGVKVAEAQGEA